MKKFLFALLVAIGILPLAANAVGTLGVSVTILAKSDGSQGDLSSNSSLWFSIQPGGTQYREFLINSASNIEQELKFELYQVKYIDGVATIDSSQKAEAEKWVTFSPSTLNLKPRQITKVKMTFNVPSGTKFGNYDGYLRVIASGKSNPIDKDAKVQAVITNSLAFDQKFWLGIGDGEFLKTDFELDSVRGVIRDDKKYILVKTNNIGGTPIAPRGSIQLQDMVFEENKLGPLDAASSEILPGESGWVAAEVPASTNDGKWKIFANISQGNIVKTKTFEEDIEFKEESSGLSLPWKYILVFIFGLLLLFGIRLTLLPKNPGKNIGPGFNFKLPVKIKAKNLEPAKSQELSELSIDELQALILERKKDDKSNASKVSVNKAKAKSASVKNDSKQSATKSGEAGKAKKTAKKTAKKSVKKTSKKSAKKSSAKPRKVGS